MQSIGMRLTRRLVLLAALGALAVPALAQDKGCAVVLLHGKWGTSQLLASLGRQLEPACTSQAIELPWSRRRGYDQPYAKALDDIAQQVKALRAQGYRRVLLAGHSMGANAALAYMAQVGDVDGVVALAPGHSPESMYRRGIGKDAVDQARELVAAGKGDEMLSMEDLNMGQRRSMRMSAQVLLSYFDPEGLGNMPLSAAHFKKPVPLLWVAGTQDPLNTGGPEPVFSHAPAHPASKYLVVQADHMGTPDVAAPQVLAWIQALP